MADETLYDSIRRTALNSRILDSECDPPDIETQLLNLGIDDEDDQELIIAALVDAGVAFRSHFWTYQDEALLPGIEDRWADPELLMVLAAVGLELIGRRFAESVLAAKATQFLEGQPK